MNLDEEHIVAPEHSHLFAASGAALNHNPDVSVNITDLCERLSKGIKMEMEIKRMEPLFVDRADYDVFRRDIKNTV